MTSFWKIRNLAENWEDSRFTKQDSMLEIRPDEDKNSKTKKRRQGKRSTKNTARGGCGG
ncbi:hypothetical protein NPIL_353761, partial [Nephila pilipes]